MMTYSAWKALKLSVTNLLLDAENPRIPSEKQGMGQRELLAELIRHDGVYALAQGIAENGFYPDKALVVIRGAEKKYIVLEGNRRCAALKALLSPSSAPDEYQARFRKLSSRIVPDLIRHINVCVAPGRHEAWPLIIATHTTKQIEEWSPAMKARVYAALIHQGQTPEEIAESCHISPATVRQHLRDDQMYRVACNLDLPSDVASIVSDARKFPLSTFARLFSSKHVQDFLGYEFHDGWLLKGKVQIPEFKKGLIRLVCDIARDKIDSRKVNKQENIVAHLKTFGDEAPNLKLIGDFTADALLGSPLENIANSKTKQDRFLSHNAVAAKVRSQRALIPRTFKDCSDPRLHGLLCELKKMPVDVYPFGVAVLFRTLVETSLENFLVRTGEMLRMTAKKRAEPGKKQRTPLFAEMLEMLANTGTDVISDAAMRKQVQRLCASSGMSEISVFNQFVHNRYVTPSESELRCLWDNFQPLIGLFLEGL